jgi:hypothetical protein
MGASKRCRGRPSTPTAAATRTSPPLFEITENGNVLCAHDGKPVTNTRQTLAEGFYWQTVEWGGDPNLIHDEEGQAFYTPDGELALSRDYVNLPALFGRWR